MHETASLGRGVVAAVISGPKREPVPESVARTCLVVLGMHRSGTSALAGSLGLLGVTLPADPIGPHPDSNPKGYFESRVLNNIHEGLLEALHSAWYDIRAINPDAIESDIAQRIKTKLIKAVESEYDGASFFVLKDPRICRFFQLWRSVIEDSEVSPRVVFSVRNPLEVARSLRKRDGLSILHGLGLWLRHMLEAEYYSRDVPRVFVDYADLVQDWRTVMDGVERKLGIALPTRRTDADNTVDEFIDVRLRHEVSSLSELRGRFGDRGWVVPCYQAFTDLTRDPSDGSAMERLDLIRAGFEEPASFFGAGIKEYYSANRDLKQNWANWAAQTASALNETLSIGVGPPGGPSIVSISDLQQVADLSFSQPSVAVEMAKALVTNQLLELADLKKQLVVKDKETTHQIARLAKDLASSEANAAKFEEAALLAASQKSKELAQLKSALVEARTCIAKSEEHAKTGERQSEEILRLEKELAEAQVRIASQTAKLQERVEDGSRKEANLLRAQECIAELENANRATASQRSRKVARRRKDLAKARARIANLNEVVQQRSKEVTRLEKKLAEVPAVRAELQRRQEESRSERTTLTDQLREVTQNLSQRDSTIDGLRENLREIRDRNAKLSESFSQQATDVEELRKTLMMQLQELVQCRTQIKSIHESTSWRCTAPFRGVVTKYLALKSKIRRTLSSQRPSSSKH